MSYREEKHMGNIPKYVAAATIGLLMSINLSPAATTHSSREAAIHKCNAVTLKNVPKADSSNSHQRRRSAVWKDCMVSLGHRP